MAGDGCDSKTVAGLLREMSVRSRGRRMTALECRIGWYGVFIFVLYVRDGLSRDEMGTLMISEVVAVCQELALG